MRFPKRPALLGLALSVGALGAGAFVLSPPAAAQGTPTLKQYGWWLIANYDPTATAPYQAPDAPDLHIGYGPNPDGAEKQDPTSPANGPTEISAVQYQLPDPIPQGTDSNIPVATLKLAVDTAYTPKVSPQASLLACQSLDPWSAVNGGNWQVRDTYDQAGCSAGVLDSSGTVFTFSVTAGMVQGLQTIDIAIVPGFVPVGLGNPPDPTNPPPGPWTIDLRQPASADAVTVPVMSSSIPSDLSLPSQSAAAPGSLGALPPGSVIGGGVPAGGPPASTGPAGKPGYAVPTTLAGGAARLSSLTQGRLIAAAMLLLLLIAGMVLMGMDVQRLLTPSGQQGGLGRFARQRSGPPLPI